jgi:hypothetical protein
MEHGYLTPHGTAIAVVLTNGPVVSILAVKLSVKGTGMADLGLGFPV